MQHFSIRAWREYRGAARVRLNTIRLHPDKKRSFVQEDANRLQKIYEEQTCRNDDPENRIIVAVSERNLVRALDTSKATLGDLNHASGSLIELEFGKQQLICLDGQSRLKAGLEFLPYDEQWWQVDIVLDTINKEKENIIVRRFCNELAPKHGVLYYWIRIAENDGDVKDAKVLRSLLPRTLNNYLTTIDRCGLTKRAFDLVLMNVPGLRPQFLLGITRHLHATLCEPEYQHYLESYLFGFWLDLMDQDVEKLNSIDGVTVEKLQGMAPGVSKTDAETLNELFEQRAVFEEFDEHDREIIQFKLMSYKGIIPSLNLFHVHYKYLERWAGRMKMLLDKPLRKVQLTPCKEQLKPALRKIFSSNQSNGKCQVEISMNKWRDRSGSFEERFDWSYRQLWLFVMRDHGDEKSCIRGLAYTAQKLGFKSARIDEEAEAYENAQESTNLSRYRPSRRVTIGERISIQGRKAQDWEKEWRKGQRNLFLGEVESHRETAEEVTTLFLQKFIYHAFFGQPISKFWSQVDNHPVDDESSSDSDAINYYDALSQTADGSSDDGFEVEQYTVFPEMPPPTSRSTAGTSRHFEQNIPRDTNSQRGSGHQAICSSCGGISPVDTPNRLERERHATISELGTERTDGELIDTNEVSDSGEMLTALDSCSVSSPIRFSTPFPSNGPHECPESPLLGGRDGLEYQVLGNECVLYDPHGITAIGNHAGAVASTEDMVERVGPTSISQSRGLTTVIQRMNNGRRDYRYYPYTRKAQQKDLVLQAASSYHYLAGHQGKLSKKKVPSARRRQPSDPGYRPVCHSIDEGFNYEHSIHPSAEADLDIQIAGNECVLYDPHGRHGIPAIGNDAAAVASTENMVERVSPTSISQSRGFTTVIQRMNNGRRDYRYYPYTRKAQQKDLVLQAASSYHYLAGHQGKLSKKKVPSARRRQPSDPGYRPVCHSIDEGFNYEHSIHPSAEADLDIQIAGNECVLYDPHGRHGIPAIGNDAAAVANTENMIERVSPTSISQSRGLTTVIRRMNNGRRDYRYYPYTRKAQQKDLVLQAASSYHYLEGHQGKLSKKKVPSARRRQPSDPGYRPVCHSIDEGFNYEHFIHPPAEADLDIQVAGNAFVLYDRQLEPREATIDNDGDAMKDTGELVVWSGDDNSDTAGSTASTPGDAITELETLNYARTVATLGSSRSLMVSSRSYVQRSSTSLGKGGLPSVTDISWTLARSKSVSEMTSESAMDSISSWCPSTVISQPEPRTSNQSETGLSVGPDIHATAYCISGRICEIEDIPPQAISNLQEFNGGIETVGEVGLAETGSASSANSEPKTDTALAAITTKASTLPLPPLRPVEKDVHAEQGHTHTTDDHFASTLPYSEECYILDKDVYEPPPIPRNASSNHRLQSSEAVYNTSHQGEVVAQLAKSQLVEATTEPKRTSQTHSTTIDFHQRRILAFNKHLHRRRKVHSPQTQNVSSSTPQMAPADATTSAARFEYQTPPRLDDYVFIVELNDEILVRSMEAAETEQIRHQVQTYEENTHVVFYTKALQRIPRPPSRNSCDPVDILCRLKVLVVMCTKWCIDDNIRAAVSEAVSKEQEIISYMCKKRKISGNVDGDRLLSNEQLYQNDGGERDNWQEYLPMSYGEDETTIEYTTERSEVALGKRRRNVQYDQDDDENNEGMWT